MTAAGRAVASRGLAAAAAVRLGPDVRGLRSFTLSEIFYFARKLSGNGLQPWHARTTGPSKTGVPWTNCPPEAPVSTSLLWSPPLGPRRRLRARAAVIVNKGDPTQLLPASHLLRRSVWPYFVLASPAPGALRLCSCPFGPWALGRWPS